MKRGEQEELNNTIAQLENDDQEDSEREEELDLIIDRLCDMTDKDFIKFMRYMRYERKARKQLGDMSQYA